MGSGVCPGTAGGLMAPEERERLLVLSLLDANAAVVKKGGGRGAGAALRVAPLVMIIDQALICDLQIWWSRELWVLLDIGCMNEQRRTVSPSITDSSTFLECSQKGKSR